MSSMTNSSRPSRVTPKFKHNHFSNYTSALFQSATKSIDNTYAYLPLSQRLPVSISFPTTSPYSIYTTPTQKHKLFSDTSSAKTVNPSDTKTTAKSTTYKPTVSSYATLPIS